MKNDQEVKVLWGGGRTDPSQRQGDDRRRLIEVLLRAEAEWFAGAATKAAAIADINFIRVTSGGLPNSSLTVASSDQAFIDELLLQRRYSLLFEGHRWIDHRRFNRLSPVYFPLDQPNHFIAKVQPVTQAECLIRINETTPEMRGPGCP